MVIDVPLAPTQAAFLDCSAAFAALAGGIGSGKSFTLCYDLLARARPGGLYMVAAPTYPMLRDATMRSFFDVATRLGQSVRLNRAEHLATLPNGAEVLFRSADAPERMRGPNLAGVALDEASLMDEDVFLVAIGRLRQRGHLGWLRAAYTPRGRRHWTYKVFATGKDGAAHFRVRTADNPFLPETFEQTVRGQYTSVYAAQELEGEYIDAEGGHFNRAWVKVVPAAPAAATRVRYWDKAGTDGGGDWTCGVLVARATNDRKPYEPPGLVAGRYCVEDVVRGQWSAGRREQVMRATAEADRRKYGYVRVVVEQEPGSGGKESAEATARNLAGFDVRLDRVTGDKVARFQPFAAQAEAGNVDAVESPWLDDWLAELAAFPEGAHDDQADATAGSFNHLAAQYAGGAELNAPPRGRRHAADLLPGGVFLEG